MSKVVESVCHQVVVDDSRDGSVPAVFDARLLQPNPIVVGYIHARFGSKPVSLPGLVERGRPDYLMSFGD